MYKKNNVPSEPAALPAFLDQELSTLEKSQTDPRMALRLIIQNAAPRVSSSDRFVTYAEADGVNWNPGSGAGLYAYRSGAWVFIG